MSELGQLFDKLGAMKEKEKVAQNGTAALARANRMDNKQGIQLLNIACPTLRPLLPKVRPKQPSSKGPSVALSLLANHTLG